MDFHWNEEQLELREVARAFLAEHSTGDALRAVMGSELGFDPALWKQLGAELGWTAVAIPEEFGGLGLGFVELTALLEVMGEALLCSPFFASVCLGARVILEAGNDDQKREWLPAIAEGECIATLAFSEASGRWDATSIETTFEEDGDGFVLSGTKRFVPDGHCADLLVVVARRAGSRGDDGIALFAVSAQSPGISRRRLPTMDQGFRQAEIEFDSVRIPASARLAGSENGAKALERTLALAAVGLAAEQVGGAQRCLDMAVAYASEREQFGRPIGSFQAIQHKCADMMVKIESARSAAYYAGCAAAESSEDLLEVASIAKAAASDAYSHAAAEALQIFGGVGFTWEYDIHLYFKRARSTAKFLGDVAYHRERVARYIGLGVST
jgi:alkylation response protein AidB-like acyl-CoA dehydrogenase